MWDHNFLKSQTLYRTSSVVNIIKKSQHFRRNYLLLSSGGYYLRAEEVSSEMM
jgi:hypothetical protein